MRWDVEVRARYVDDALTTARANLIAHRLPLFAACWVGTTTLWSMVLMSEGLLGGVAACVTVALQSVALALAYRTSRARDTNRRRPIPRALAGVCIFLGVSSTAMFAAARGSGDVLAFVLLTLYLATALFFAWGWRAQMLVWIGTLVPWLVAIPFLTFTVPAIELGTAIVIGSVLSWAIAEGTCRTFRSAWLHRFAETRFRRELEEARDAAEAATRAKDQFLATVSHELRSPLATIITWTQILRRGRVDAETTARAVDVIERTARMQARLIEDLLDVARITAGTLHLELSRVDAREAVRALVDTFSVAAETKSIELVCEPGDHALPVHADPMRLQQILGNLVTNAVKFTSPGGRIVVAAHRAGDTVEVLVRDNGIGMAPDVVARVFERFHQVDVAGGRYGGLGLGLEIARYLITVHGGSIDAKSDGLGQGSTFTVRLPLLADAPADAPADAAAERATITAAAR